MKTVTIRCDRCGETIETGRALLTVEAGTTPSTWQADSVTGRPTVDLCASCMTALAKWLASRHEAER